MYRSCSILTGSYLIYRTEKPSKSAESDLTETSEFRLGAGRSQVQILSPRLSVPSNRAAAGSQEEA